jgi:hypothetical protein
VAWLWQRSNRDGPGQQRAQTPEGKLSLYKARASARELMKTYPQPRWWPADFKVQMAIACFNAPSWRGAFLGVDDNLQLRLSARRASGTSHFENINSDLSIFIAATDRMPALAGKVTGDWEPLTLRTGKEGTVEARYYDSHPGNPNEPRAAHCVALHRDGFAILVSSSHKNRLVRADLERVAASIS